jgi:23S rRNA A2030 N6-methylase RlmJ
MQQNTARRPYNHCRYAGNIGDVWKHILLIDALRTLSSDSPKSFHYVETHAGPGYARLGENGDWRRGIGRFMDGTAELLDHYYFNLVLPAMNANFLYKGSWVLAAEFLRNVGHPNFKLTVHEVNADTLKMAGSAIRKGQLSQWVKLEPKSGYDALQKVEKADLVLVDPPYRSSDGTADDWDKVMNALARVKSMARHWMVWYPLFRRQEPDALIAMSGGASFELSWAEDAPGWVMKGCGLLMDPASAKILKQRSSWLASLAERLGGRFDLRSATTAKTEPSQNIGSAHHGSTGDNCHAQFLSNPVHLL